MAQGGKDNRKIWIVAAAAALLAAVALLLVVLLLPDDEQPGDTAPPVAVRPSPADAALPDGAEAELTPDATAASARADARRRPKRGWRKITDRELRRLQRRNSPLMRACYARLSRRTPSMVQGRANVTVQLGERGRIKSVSVQAGDRALEGCLRRSVLRWRFSHTLKPQRISFPVVVAGR